MKKEFSTTRYRSSAMQRYARRLAVCMILYTGLIFGVGFLFRLAPPTGVLAWVMAVLPALPILGVFWTIARPLIEKTDEFMRMIMVRMALFATAFCLSIMTIWEFLQNFGVLPAGTGGFGTTFVWFVGLGVGAVWNALANRAEAEE